MSGGLAPNTFETSRVFCSLPPKSSWHKDIGSHRASREMLCVLLVESWPERQFFIFHISQTCAFTLTDLRQNSSGKSFFLPDKIPLDGNIPHPLTQHCQSQIPLGAGCWVHWGVADKTQRSWMLLCAEIWKVQTERDQQKIHCQTHPSFK